MNSDFTIAGESAACAMIAGTRNAWTRSWEGRIWRIQLAQVRFETETDFYYYLNCILMKFAGQLIPFATAVLLAGCGTLLPPSGTIAGRDAPNAVVVVPKKQDVKIRDGRIFQFPAGRYTALEDDEEGIYFESPDGILIDDVFF